MGADEKRAAVPPVGDDPGLTAEQRARMRRNAWRRAVPWEGRATRADIAILVGIGAVIGIGMVVRPFKPFLIAHHPVLLEFLTGDLLVIGAGAAFARVGEAPLWLVIVAGVVGMVKFDWLMWWAGRRWGAGIIRMVTVSETTQRFAARATEWNPWVLRVAVVLAVLPGVPAPVVLAAAGWVGMGLGTFLLLDLLGATAMTALVAVLGYRLGQQAVDVVLLIDDHAGTVSLALIAVALLFPLVRSWFRRMRTRSGP